METGKGCISLSFPAEASLLSQNDMNVIFKVSLGDSYSILVYFTRDGASARVKDVSQAVENIPRFQEDVPRDKVFATVSMLAQYVKRKPNTRKSSIILL